MATWCAFNGTFTPPRSEDDSRYYFHFDSWRMNVQPGIWLPVAVYVEETERIEGEKNGRLKAQTPLLGLLAQAPHQGERKRQRQGGRCGGQERRLAGCGSLQATRAVITQAENNVIDRLVEAGLVAPLTPGGYENTVLDQIVVNLVVPTTWPSPTRCTPAFCFPPPLKPPLWAIPS